MNPSHSHPKQTFPPSPTELITNKLRHLKMNDIQQQHLRNQQQTHHNGGVGQEQQTLPAPNSNTSRAQLEGQQHTGNAQTQQTAQQCPQQNSATDSNDAIWNDIVGNELTFLMQKQFSMEDQRKKYQMPYCC
eukprot:CAMPEP_0117442606 /NCGR_PEP_ID=MMETSP0759-20121206/4244_1 /TAXON_ID=63605 /ORGANISM="Percolomonas cosmopolitus, Strain WS" /LENGTH=131 /DNA_ID=CAMNT_0005234511 /DNA_START=53 /DNA_END=448 /DNA_ORIENTATION=+